MGHKVVPGSLNGNAPPQNIVHGTYPQMIMFLVFNMWTSHFGLPLLLAIILWSKDVKRHPTFINLCVSFIIIGISSSLLLYGHAISGPEPPQVLCLLQASLLYGMPNLTSMAALMLVCQMFLRVRSAHYGKPYEDEDHVIRLWMMLVVPYVSYIIPVLATSIIGANNPRYLSRNRRFFYCSLDCLPLTNAIAVTSAIVLFVTVVIIGWSMFMLIRHRTVTRSKESRLHQSKDLSFHIRIMVFGLYLILAMSLSLLSISSPSSPVPDLAICTAATVIILVFGTQTDVLQALCFWRRNTPRVVPVEQDLRRIDLTSAFESERVGKEDTLAFARISKF